MREYEGIVLAAAAYLVFLLSVLSFLVKIRLIVLSEKISPGFSSRKVHLSPAAAGKAACDIFFLVRLLKANDVLWVGEWLFHLSFLLVALRHLRYFLHPLPSCLAVFQQPGIIAGYILPFTLLYAAIVKYATARKYISSYNLFLLGLLLLLGTTGILTGTVFRTDVISVKLFVFGLLRFSPVAAPQGFLFAAHFMLALLLLLCLPSHLIAAPLTMLDARKREEEVMELMHGKRNAEDR